ncbi:MAG: acyl--CoA ligase [Gammaproteobacteria bacterium]|nr:acyl--CoA ligase [Gammaproteobacteria bacterium]MYF27745.1 acyl--CoA ligase [Gammaproteobacteria bacterium]MYK45614.1 acyl--CoA ligase [Gammaproteobacteria bacterium]
MAEAQDASTPHQAGVVWDPGFALRPELANAIAEVTASGKPHETRVETIRGVTFTVFANAPNNLRDLYASALSHAQKDFYVYQDERYTFQAMWDHAAQCANRLRARGIEPGDRVGIALRNYPEWIAAFMAITSMGAVAVAMNAWWSGEELVYGIEDSGLKILFTDVERTERLLPHLEQLDIDLVTVRHRHEGLTTWEEFIHDAATEMPQPEIAPEDNATILYTSGSTAHPKGVLSTHRAITNALMGWECGGAIAMALNPQMGAAVGRAAPPPQNPPSIILTVPLFHVTGLVVQTLMSFRHGRKVVGMYKWDVEEALRIIQDERITEFNGVPTMAWELVQAPNRGSYDLSSLKSAGGGGAPMAPEHARQIDKTIAKGAPGTGWGMTETQGLATTIGGPAFLQRPRSCGRAVPPIVKVKAVKDDGTDAAPLETGELWIWGVQNFTEYWNKPDATAESLTDGWVHTGDIGHLDEEGYVFITDREKDMVLRGGENIGCQEVEAVLYEHPSILEAAVFGVPDERLGETVATVVVVRPGMALTVDEVQSFAAEHLARFKVPDHVWLRSERLPRIASEKIFKRGLREEAIALLASAQA